MVKAEAELERIRKDRAEGDPVPLVRSGPVTVGKGVEIRLGGGDSDDSDDMPVDESKSITVSLAPLVTCECRCG